MATKEHHFVPQFYLRLFSDDGRRINAFNFKLNRTIHGVSIKQRCSKRNFYGFVPDLEKALGHLEGATVDVIRRLRETRTLPPAGTSPWEALITFIVFQKLRTTSAAQMDDAMVDYLGKLWLQSDPATQNLDPESFKIRSAFPVAVPLSVAGDLVPAASDLQPHLFVNGTGHGFITSDDPVVTHNQWCEGITHRGVSGWSCSGLQVFWPISPTELLLLFDSDVYKVGRSRRGEQVSIIDRPDDVSALNGLQILNAHQNVYFSGDATRESLRSASRRPAKRHAFVETDEVPNKEGGTSSLLHTYTPLLPMKLHVSAISVRKKARQVALLERSAHYRHALAREEIYPGPGDHVTPAGPYHVKRTVWK